MSRSMLKTYKYIGMTREFYIFDVMGEPTPLFWVDRRKNELTMTRLLMRV